jgi:hypothetical protein
MSAVDLNAVRCEALFVSPLQRSDQPTPTEVRQAIRRAVRVLGTRGCAARVAQEFGDHPEVAVERMRWARRLVEDAHGQNARSATVHTLWRGAVGSVGRCATLDPAS